MHQIGIIGLGVMGLSLARNMRSKGLSVIGYDTHEHSRQTAEEAEVATTESLGQFVQRLESPRRILIMVPAGDPVDAVLDALRPLLKKGDSVVDGGNSYFKDTARREQALEAQGIHFLGLGVSGGQRGALEGPGMMAGGSREAFALWKDDLEAIAARFQGEPCVAYLGPGGAGHYVKMVHNGIEYGLMQNIAEAYSILRHEGQLSNEELAQVFQDWNQGDLRGYLIAISANIFQKKNTSDEYWIDNIKDVAAQKGTGTWTVMNSLELGVPIPGIDAAVRQRQLSAFKSLRDQFVDRLSNELPWNHTRPGVDPDILKDAVHCSHLLIYTQGLHLLSEAKKIYTYSYGLADVAKIWRNGCIISSSIVEFLAESLNQEDDFPLLNTHVWEAVLKNIGPLRSVSFLSQSNGLPLAALSANFAYWCSLSTNEMPTNLIQAQRDYFGGHGLELKSGEKTSLDWEGSTN